MKERIMETAFSLFLNKGYATGVSEIVNKAGVSKGALYHHFNNKEDLFEQTVQAYFLNRRKDYAFVRNEDMSIYDRIQKIIHTYYNSFIHSNGKNRLHPEIISNLFHIMAEYAERPQIRQAFYHDYEMLQEAFRELLKNHRYGKGFIIDTDKLAEISANLTKGHLIDLIFQKTNDIKSCIDNQSHLIWTMINSYTRNETEY